MKARSLIRVLTAATLTVSAVTSCSLFKSSDGETSGKIVPNVGGTGGATGAGSQGASGGSIGAGGAGGSPASTCAGLPGPAMVEIVAPGGQSFCIDRTEVTQAQYADFLKAATTKPGSEHADCASNSSYVPKTNPPGPDWEPTSCVDGVVWTPDTTPNRPVVCLDWCDAFAYCAWAGKRLCGKLGGGRNTLTATFDASDPGVNVKASQWYVACSQGGKTVYPYGDAYSPEMCEGYDVVSHDGGNTSQDPWTAKEDVATRPGCHGTVAPFTGLRDLSGSVMEFTDECMIDTTTPGQVVVCGARGGGFLDGAGELRCKEYAAYAQQSYGEDKGFRCCKDLP